MTTRIVLRALHRSLDQIRFVAPVPPRTATGLVARVYGQVERDFGMLAPPVALHAPAPDVLAACWLMLRETLLAPGAAARADKEAVAAGVSLANACPYCVTVHTATLHGLRAARDGLDIAADRPQAITDPGRRALTLWARASGSEAAVSALEAPFPAGSAPEHIGVAVTFHYLNRMVNVFLTEGPVPPAVPAAARRPVARLLGTLMGPAARRGARPGESLALLPGAPLPDDLAWAAGNPRIAAAFARSAAAIDRAGRASVPRSVRHLVTARLAGWRGEPMGLGRGWVEEDVAALPAADRPAGRLALLTALASHQVGPGDVEPFGRRLGDRATVELASWASMSAARHAGGWMVRDRGTPAALQHREGPPD